MLSRRSLFRTAFVAAGYFAMRRALPDVEEREAGPVNGTLTIMDADYNVLAEVDIEGGLCGTAFARETGTAELIRVDYDGGRKAVWFPATDIDWNTRQFMSGDTITMTATMVEFDALP